MVKWWQAVEFAALIPFQADAKREHPQFAQCQYLLPNLFDERSQLALQSNTCSANAIEF